MPRAPYAPRQGQPLFSPGSETAEAEAFAHTEIGKLDRLLRLRGWDPCSTHERAILVTYIKARELGMFEDLPTESER